MIDKKKVVGWNMTPAEVRIFFISLGKKVVTFFGYSVDYENKNAMLKTAKDALSLYSPTNVVINIGATAGGIGAVYPLARELGFTTTGIVSSVAMQDLKYISNAIDHICFVEDAQWGGKLPNSNELSPTSQAMISCSDVLIAIGGGEVTRDELMAGKGQGKAVHFYPAEISHEYLIQQARKKHQPAPKSFWGAAHEVFGKRS